jgi:LysM repeat protein
MRILGQLMMGFLTAILSTAVVVGSFLLSLAEGGQHNSQMAPPSQTPPPVQITTSAAIADKSRPTSTATSTDTEYIRTCNIPIGWQQITIQPGDTLESLAEEYASEVGILAYGNCLPASGLTSLLPGTYFYVPPLPSQTATTTQTATHTHRPKPGSSSRPSCGPPQGWILYTVTTGDTLYSISRAFYTTISQLQFANCLGSSTVIRVGQKLYAPNVATRTPVPKPTKKPTTQAPPVVTTEPPVVTTEPPIVTTEPPVVTTEPPVVTTEPPVVTTEPPPYPSSGALSPVRIAGKLALHLQRMQANAICSSNQSVQIPTAPCMFAVAYCTGKNHFLLS